MKKISLFLIFSLLLFLVPLNAIKVNHYCDFHSSNTGQHVFFDASGEPWTFDSITVSPDYLEIDNGADSERFIATVSGGECKFTIDVWDPDNTTQDAIIASWTADASDYTKSYTFYSSSSDGYINHQGTDYDTIQSDDSGTAVVDAQNDFVVGQRNIGGLKPYHINRAFLFFDTSSIPDNEVPISATISLFKETDYSDTDFDITVQTGGSTYPHDPIVLSDYDRDHYSGNGGTLNTSSISTGYNNITLNSTGVGWISTTGITKFCLRSSRDIDSIAPTGDECVTFSTKERGEGYEPKLTVNTRASSVSYEITGLEPSQAYQIWIDGSYDHDETTDASGTLTWTGHDLDTSHSIDIKYGEGIILGVSTTTETISIGYLDKGTTSTSQSCVIENTGNVVENIKIKFSQFTDSSGNTWVVGTSPDVDQCVIEWSIDDTNYNKITAYDTYVTVKTNLAVNDTFTLYIRITAPTESSSYDEYSSTMTIGCEQA